MPSKGRLSAGKAGPVSATVMQHVLHGVRMLHSSDWCAGRVAECQA